MVWKKFTLAALFLVAMVSLAAAQGDVPAPCDCNVVVAVIGPIGNDGNNGADSVDSLSISDQFQAIQVLGYLGELAGLDNPLAPPSASSGPDGGGVDTGGMMGLGSGESAIQGSTFTSGGWTGGVGYTGSNWTWAGVAANDAVERALPLVIMMIGASEWASIERSILKMRLLKGPRGTFFENTRWGELNGQHFIDRLRILADEGSQSARSAMKEFCDGEQCIQQLIREDKSLLDDAKRMGAIDDAKYGEGAGEKWRTGTEYFSPTFDVENGLFYGKFPPTSGPLPFWMLPEP